MYVTVSNCSVHKLTLEFIIINVAILPTLSCIVVFCAIMTALLLYVFVSFGRNRDKSISLGELSICKHLHFIYEHCAECRTIYA